MNDALELESTVILPEEEEVQEPVKKRRSGRKKSVELEEGKGKHIDAVFKESTYDAIQKIVDEEDLPTRSAFMREAVEFYLLFKKIARPDNIITVYESDGVTERYKMPANVMVKS